MIESLSPNARACRTLGAVQHRATIVLRYAIALVLLASVLPGRARAQESETDAPPADAVENDEAAQAEENAVVGGTYEPDQRGEHEEPGEQEERGEENVELQSSEVTGDVATASAPAYGGSDELGFELRLWLGGAATSLDPVGDGNLVSSAQDGGIGGAVGFGGAVRFGSLRIGPRVGFTIDPSFVLTNIALGADYLLTSDEIVPYLRASVGMSIVDLLGDAPAQQSTADIFGIGVEVGAGARWYAYRGLFLGLELTGGWHHLWRAAVPDCTGGCTAGAFDLRRSGESNGLSLRLSIDVGWTF